MKRTAVRLSEDQLNRLRDEARTRGTSVAEIIREAVERYLAGPESRVKLAFAAVGEGASADGSERVDEYVRETIRKQLPAE